MESSSPLFDTVLAALLVAITVRVLLARELFESIVLFIVFGMLLGIAWCRLDAVDIALAEVAIGAGLTGALFLNTLSATQTWTIPPSAAQVQVREFLRPGPSQRLLVAAALLYTVATAGAAAAVTLPLAQRAPAAAVPIAEKLDQSGVANPVTAVLLNFRAYDTLLEVAVLMAAVVGVPAAAGGAPCMPRPGPVLDAFTRLLLPIMLLVACYVLWAGTKAPGGAFPAAAILGAGGVLRIVCGAEPPHTERAVWRGLAAAGLGIFVLVACGGFFEGGAFLQLAPARAFQAIVLVETALTVSIAMILVLLFRATAPRRDAEIGTRAENTRIGELGRAPLDKERDA